MKRRIVAAAGAVILSTTLWACGGGGGNDGTTGPLPPGSTDDTTFGTLAIDDTNAEAIALSVSLSEGALAFTQMIANAVVVYGSNAGTPEVACGNTGSITIVHEDNDVSFDVSAGDSVTLEFSSCYNDLVDAISDGSVVMDVDDFVLDAANARLSGSLSTTGAFLQTDPIDPKTVAEVTTSSDFSFVDDEPELLTMTATGSQHFTVELAGFSESMSSFTLTRTAVLSMPGGNPRDVDTDVDIINRYNSDILGGSFSCDTSSPLEFPDFSGSTAHAGEIICRGRNSSAVRITQGSRIDIDPEGDGSFSTLGTLDWATVIDGFLLRESGLRLTDLTGPLRLRKISIRAADAVHDVARGRVLMLTASDDANWPNALVELSIASNSFRQLLSFADTPGLLRISDDGSVFYVAFTESGELHRYDTANLQQLDVINIHSDQAFSTDYGITDVAVSPLDATVIAVTFRFLPNATSDVIVIDGTVQREISYRDSIAQNQAQDFDSLEFSSDGQRLFASSSAGSSAILEVDAGGITQTTIAQHMFGNHLQRIGNRLHSFASVYDDSSLVRTGSYQTVLQRIGIDPVNNLTFTIQDDTLSVFSRDRFVLLASYDLTLDANTTILNIVPAGAQVLIVDENQVRFADVADIDIQVAGTCDLLNLSTASDEPYIRYSCPVIDAVYDETRSRTYAAIDSSLGSNGNSIAVIDNISGAVSSFVFVGANPRQLAISGDAAQLYVTFSGADAIVTVNLDTLSVVRETQIEPVLQPGTVPTLYRRSVLGISASPVETDTFVVSLGEINSSPFERFVAFRNGIRLANEVHRSEMQNIFSSSVRQPLFDGSGGSFSIGVNGNTAFIESLSLDSSGLSVGTFFDAAPAGQGNSRPDVVLDTVFTDRGGVIDLTGQTGEARYNVSSMTIADNRGGRAVAVDAVIGDVYLLVGAAASQAGIGRFDLVSGAFLAEEQFDSVVTSFSGLSLFEIGTDRLGLVTHQLSGLVIIDKASIQ